MTLPVTRGPWAGLHDDVYHHTDPLPSLHLLSDAKWLLLLLLLLIKFNVGFTEVVPTNGWRPWHFK